MIAHLLSTAVAMLAAAPPTPTGPAGMGGAAGGVLVKPGYDELLRQLLQALIFLANLGGGLVVGVSTVRALAHYVGELFERRGGEVPKEAIRLSLGRSLALALEFQLGADILGTALDPSLQDIATLGAIVVLRTVLNFFLGRELAEDARRAAGEPDAGARRP